MKAKKKKPDRYADLEVTEIEPFMGEWSRTDRNGKTVLADKGGIVIRWGCSGVGWGEVIIGQSGDQINIDTECMSDKFLAALFRALRRKAKVVG